MKITHLITMAGRGSRFQTAGYRGPKFLVEVRGRTLLDWSLSSLPIAEIDRVIVVALKQHETDHGLAACIRQRLPNVRDIHFKWIEETTDGQATTASLAAEFFLPDIPLAIANIDTAFRASTLRHDIESGTADGWLGSFPAHDAKYSFAKTDAEGWITEVREKQVISSNALSGLYTFRNGEDFLRAYEEGRRTNLRVKGELYIAPLYNLLMRDGRRFRLTPAEWCYPLGTPEEVDAFAKITL